MGPDSILCLEHSVAWTLLPVRDAEPRKGLAKGTLLSWKKLLSHCSRLGHFLLAGSEGRPCAGRSSWFPSGPNSGRLLRKKEEKVRAALSPAHTSFGWAKGCSREVGDCLAWPGDLAAHGQDAAGKEPAARSCVPGCDRRGAHTH